MKPHLASTGECPPSLTDEQVIARVLDGEAPLFEILMRRHNQRLFRMARAILRNDAEAEDAVQQAYLSAYQHLAQFAGQSKFATWLTQIALNAALALGRQSSRRAEVDLSDELKEGVMSGRLESRVPSPEQVVSGREMAGLVERAVDELPEIYRVVFMMREVQQLSTAEAADCSALSEENVKVRLHRAKTLLRETMVSRMDAAATGIFPFLGERCDRIVAFVMGQLGRISTSSVTSGGQSPLLPPRRDK